MAGVVVVGHGTYQDGLGSRVKALRAQEGLSAHLSLHGGKVRVEAQGAGDEHALGRVPVVVERLLLDDAVTDDQVIGLAHELAVARKIVPGEVYRARRYPVLLREQNGPRV